MSDLSELYQEVILDHNKRPRNFCKLDQANRQAQGFNPLCGDQITIFLQMEGDQIHQICFQGSGCAISKASSSMMTEALKGKTKQEAEYLFKKFHEMLTGLPVTARPSPPSDLGKLAAFSGVCEFPSRVKCATLAWHTMKSALEEKEETVTTEEEEV